MPQVPYNPVSQVGPSGEATPGMTDRSTAEAFGGGVAAALGGLGKAVEGAGNEIFTRAMAMQELANDSEAREADSKYMIAAGELHANYNSLQGKAAVDAYPAYSKSLQDLRLKMRGELSNPMVAKKFDAASLGTMGRSIFSGAGHAAGQNRAYAVGTITSQMELDAKSVEDAPNDERAFQDKLARVKNGAADLAALQGMEPGSPQEQNLTLKATSQLWAQRIIGQARTAPFEAAKALDANKTQMTQADFLRADGIVRTQGRAVGSTNIANKVYDPEKPLKDLEAAAEAGKLGACADERAACFDEDLAGGGSGHGQVVQFDEIGAGEGDGGVFHGKMIRGFRA